jgi:hypothetical protein
MLGTSLGGALPRTPVKKLFEKSFLTIFKNFYQPKTPFSAGKCGTARRSTVGATEDDPKKPTFLGFRT